MLRGFVRARLHRRLFVWFTLGMLFTGLTVAGVSGLQERLGAGPAWHRGMEGAERLLRGRFARVWEDPKERDGLAQELSQALDLRVELEDAQRRPLAQFGPSGGRRWDELAVYAGGSTGPVRGYVQLSSGTRSSVWRSALPFGVAALVLWAFAGAISRRLAWPFYQLAQVAREVGAGHLKVRAPIRRQFGEARLLAYAINEMADRIERQLAEQRELLAAVSHELRTPLSRLRLLVELARNGKATDKLLNEMDQEAVEMDRLVGELLASARVEFGALSLSSLDPGETAARALERAGLPATLLVLAPGLPRIRADATLLLRALANLIDNAQRHGNGVERLRVGASAGGVSFEVEDGGPGFAPGDEVKVFQPFHRGSNPAPGDTLSLGLGLSLVERIARAHGGTAQARNRPGGGAGVSLTLPG